MSTSPELQEIQNNILRPVPRSYASFFFLEIIDRDTFCTALKEVVPQVQSEHAMRRASKRPEWSLNIALTYPGLMALELNQELLSSLPAPFVEGMAARAGRLGDAGASAPERWDTPFGSGRVHVVCAVSSAANDVSGIWRSAIAKGEAPAGTRLLGVELGQQITNERGEAIEHFGFRDPLSQPWVDDGMSPERSGGGVPSESGADRPLRLGEFVAGYPSEGEAADHGNETPAPLRNGTFFVFRKLRQDVVAFRRFLAERRPGDPAAQELLAAQMVGRRKDGQPLGGCGSAADLNDFQLRNGSDEERAIPRGAHIRRMNPRASDGAPGVSRHRIIRRGIPYGPPLPDEATDDGHERGMLFVALNARIDEQFEFIQSEWIQRGTSIGRPGREDDPIAGQSDEKAFAIPTRPRPEQGIPGFVRMRGGEYCWLPSLSTLGALAEQTHYRPADPIQAPRDEDDLFDLESLQRDLASAPVFVRSLGSFSIAYVGCYALVDEVLQREAEFAVPYRPLIQAMTTESDLVVGLPDGLPFRNEQLGRMRDVLPASVLPRIEGLAQGVVRQTLAVAGDQPFNAVDTIAFRVPVRVIQEFLGIPGPDALSETGLAMHFGKNAGDPIPAEWRKGFAPPEPGGAREWNLRQWARILFLEVFSNVYRIREVSVLAADAMRELKEHLHLCYDEASAGRSTNPNTVLAQLARAGQENPDLAPHHIHLLVELLVGGVETVAKATANVLDLLLEPDHWAVARAAAQDDNELDRVIHECLRLAPVAPILVRVVATETAVLGDQTLTRGDRVVLVAGAAMRDPEVFSGDQFKPDALGDLETLFAFGKHAHVCKGREVALAEIRGVLRSLLEVRHVERAPGPLGEKRERSRLADSLWIRASG